jgi:hypothetical protein
MTATRRVVCIVGDVAIKHRNVFLTQDLHNIFDFVIIVSVVETPRPLTGHRGLLRRSFFTRDCLSDITIWFWRNHNCVSET